MAPCRDDRPGVGERREPLLLHAHLQRFHIEHRFDPHFLLPGVLSLYVFQGTRFQEVDAVKLRAPRVERDASLMPCFLHQPAPVLASSQEADVLLYRKALLHVRLPL